MENINNRIDSSGHAFFVCNSWLVQPVFLCNEGRERLFQPVAVATCDSNIWVLAAGPLAVAAGISSFSSVELFLFFVVFLPLSN